MAIMEFEEKREYKKSIKLILNFIIGILLFVVGYFSYALFTPQPKTNEDEQLKPILPHILQLDVLNGCGTKGVASKFTDYLRRHGFDVVEMKNYKTFQVQQTLVIDRVGNLASAQRVAEALGVSEQNIIQQINPDYFVDVSVIIGKDYSTLKLSQ